ncbi:MAG: M14 family zinc carboxypeptidase [Candidatus Limiplasma sp.]|nr:M14 family zinc carboxypeptidase [Candidatus Limiplasma sp.]
MPNLHVDANFPGGGVDHPRWEGNTLYFEAPLDHSPQSLWFYFRIRNGQGQRLTLVQKGLERVLGVRESRGYQPVVPVWRDGEEAAWQRVDESAIAYTQEPLAFQFEIAPTQPVCYVAFCFPYLLRDWEAFAATLPREYVYCAQAGLTKAGRPFNRYLIRSPRHKPEHLLVVTARQHAGEVSGSYVLEGLLRRLTDGSPEMESLLAKAALCVFPLMDLDCVQEGRYGKDQAPYDFNRDWRYEPFHPEIAGVYSQLEELCAQYRLWWAFDLHAPQPGGASYMPPSRCLKTDSPDWRKMWNLAIRYEDACAGRASFHLKDVDTQVLNWGGMNNDGLTSFYFYARWHCNNLGLEYSYHRDGEGRVLRVEDWHTLGCALAETLADKLFDPALGEAPDRERIPAWAVDAPLQYWKSVRQVHGLQITDTETTAVMTAQAGENSAWITSPQREAGTAWQLTADRDTELTLYASYYREGLLVSHGKPEALHLAAGEPYVWQLPQAPISQCQGTLSVIARDLGGTLRICAVEA